jgi:hypothetical protein
MDYVQATVPALATMVAPPQPPPVTQGFVGFFPFDEPRATPSAPPLDDEEDTGEEIVYKPRGKAVPSAPPASSWTSNPKASPSFFSPFSAAAPPASSWTSSPSASPSFFNPFSVDSGCKSIKDPRVCNGNANCSWLGGKINACQRKRGTVKDKLVFYGPNAAFGKKRMYNVKGSPCNRLTKRICKGNANCTYTKRGCRRRSGTVKDKLVYYGPNLQFGKRRRRKGCKSKGPTKKLPAKIRKLCKRLKIKTTKRVGGRRVCKSIKTIMKQIKKRMKKSKKSRSRR